MTIILLPALCVMAIVLMGIIAMSGGNTTSAAMTERMQRREDKMQEDATHGPSTTVAPPAPRAAVGDGPA